MVLQRNVNKITGVLSICMSLIYPRTSHAVSIKRLPHFCVQVMTVLSKGDFSAPFEYRRVEWLSDKIDAAAKGRIDATQLATGGKTIFEAEDIEQFHLLNPLSRAAILHLYPEYFSKFQLQKLLSETWVLSLKQEKPNVYLEMLNSVTNQLSKYMFMARALNQFDNSIETKYSAAYRSENLDKVSQNRAQSQALGFGRFYSLKLGHLLLFDFIQRKKETVDVPASFIKGEVARVKIENLKKISIGNLIDKLEVFNSYLEFLLDFYADDLEPHQFLEIVWDYQQEKFAIYDLAFDTRTDYSFSVKSRPESWHFYGQILRLGENYNFSETEKLALFRGVQLGLRRVSGVAAKYDKENELEKYKLLWSRTSGFVRR